MQALFYLFRAKQASKRAMEHCRDYYENDCITIVEEPHHHHHHRRHPHYNNHGNSLSFQEKPVVLDDNCFRGGERYRVIDEKYGREGDLFCGGERYRVIDEKYGHEGALSGSGERHRVIDEKYGHEGGLFGGGESRVTYKAEEADYFVGDGHGENDYHRRKQHARRNFV